MEHNRGWTLTLFVSALLHATSHGAVAFCAALLGRNMVGGSSGAFLPAASALSLALIGLAAVFAKGTFGILASYAQTKLSTSAGQSLRDHTLQALLNAGPTTPIPTTIARLVSRIALAEKAIQHGPFSVARALVQLLPIAVGLALVSPSLTLIAIFVLAPFGALLSLARRSWRSLHESSMAASDHLHEEVDDLIRHLDLWRTYGSGQQVREVLRGLGSRASQTRVKSETLGVALSSANEVLGALALIAVLFVASLGFGLTDGGSVIAFIAIFFMAYRPLRDLGDARNAWLQGKEALATISTLFDRRLNEKDSAKVAYDQPVHVQVAELSVPCKCPSVSFSLPAGRMIALCGATGAGKTSLIRALLGLEPSAVGHVSINGQHVLPGQVGPCFRPFAWVPQDAPVVSGSLEDNYRMAGTDIDSVREQLAKLGANNLDHKVGKTKVGLAGRTLSGGERRWIALARALATKLPVVVLDEPTVGLDHFARQRVLQALKRSRGHRSFLIATHDEAVSSLADEVVVVGTTPSAGAEDNHER